MSKNKKNLAKETINMEKSDEVLTTKKVQKVEKLSKDEKKALKIKKSKAKKNNDKQKRNHAKEVLSELKKVNWPSFGKVCKQTGAVLTVVAVFMLAVLIFKAFFSSLLSFSTF